MKVIFAGAGMLALLAILSFVLAFQLIPTDLGNSYMIAASVLISAAALLAGMGHVGKAIIASRMAGFSPEETAPSARTMRHDAPALAAPANEAVAPTTLPPPPPAAPVNMPSIPAAPILAGAAGVVAGAAIGSQLETAPAKSPDLRLLDDLERDLFADLKVPSPPAEPEVEPPAPMKFGPVLDEPEDSALLQPKAPLPSDTGEEDGAFLAPLPPLPDFGALTLPEPPSLAIEDAAHADDDQDDLPPPVTLPEPEPIPAPPPVATTTGLIHDEDLERLSEAEADLAPLETLDVVGAYDSGGTRFTMYSDGSVTAKGEVVDQRFRSLDDLRAFIDGGMKS